MECWPVDHDLGISRASSSYCKSTWTTYLANATDPAVTKCGFPPAMPATKKYDFLKSSLLLVNNDDMVTAALISPSPVVSWQTVSASLQLSVGWRGEKPGMDIEFLKLSKAEMFHAVASWFAIETITTMGAILVCDFELDRRLRPETETEIEFKMKFFHWSTSHPFAGRTNTNVKQERKRPKHFDVAIQTTDSQQPSGCVWSMASEKYVANVRTSTNIKTANRTNCPAT